jgi:hypothetical protein
LKRVRQSLPFELVFASGIGTWSTGGDIGVAVFGRRRGCFVLI